MLKNIYRVRGVFGNCMICKYHLEPVVNRRVITNKSLEAKAAQGDWDDRQYYIFHPNESAESSLQDFFASN